MITYQVGKSARGPEHAFITGKSPGRKREIVLTRHDIEPEYRAHAWPRIVAALTGDTTHLNGE